MQKGKGKSVALGMGIGATNAVFGGGGGMLAVPALRLLGHQEKQAHATAIAVILPVSALSFLWYFLGGMYDVNVLLPTAIGTVLGGLLGGFLLDKLKVDAVRTLFGILILISGILMLAGR